MQVLFDHQIFTQQDYGGISRIYAELLKENNSFNPKLSLKFSNNHYLKELQNIKYTSFFANRYIPRKAQMMNYVNTKKTISLIKKNEFDIFHPTYYDSYFLPFLKKPFVVTFLDMIHELFGNQYPDLAQDKTVFENKKLLLQKATKAIAISESTKNDMVRIFDVDTNKIEVIHLATKLKPSNTKPIIEGDYFLFVGRRERYKNFELLAEAIAPILKENKDLKLICAGGGNFEQSENDLLTKLEIQHQVKQIPFNNDIMLSNFYTNAMAFIFPSLYEGFGIPVVEAFACNCPLLVSNVSSLPEVAGNAACYFNATDKQSIYNSINKVLNDNNYRKELKTLGQERNKLFTWDNNRKQTASLYNSITNN